MLSGARSRRPLGADKKEVDAEETELPTLDTPYSANERLHVPPLTSRPWASGHKNDSLFAWSAWVLPDPVTTKEKTEGPAHGKARARSGPLERLGGGLEKISGTECLVLAGLIVVALFVRLWRIGQPSSVVFDEVHFGGMASKYVHRQFFMDVHPPLAKLLITFASWIFRFSGNFDFKDIGKEYGPLNVPYIPMRLVPGLFGVAVIPISFFTIRQIGCQPVTAILVALLVTFDNALITQSRLILLDSPLVFFTAASVFFWSGFCCEQATRPFTRRWWIWLALTGTALGAVLSVKWVGLFTIATIGVSTIVQLWELLGDLRISLKTLFRHFVARAICLIGIPLVFYLAVFRIHFWVLADSGDGDGFMSSEFQHTLKGHTMPDTFADVALGSKISIRHVNTQGGYLHSHPHNYPTGSKQQQITLYPHRDDNNLWTVKNATVDPDFDPFVDTPVRYITDGMVIRLEHSITLKRLHSHDHRPPISEVDWQNEASGYGFEGFDGDANDHWVVEIDKDWTKKGDRQSKKRLKALRTRFRLRHLYTGCYLFSHKVKLPDWGFEQQEVTCNKNPTRPNSMWYIETNDHPLLPAKAEKVNYRRPSFFSRFLELQAVMWRTNAGLTERHAYDSRPQHWPFLRRGINFWVKNHRQIYLLGNPVIWWMSSTSIIAYILVRLVLILRAKRQYQDLNHTTLSFYDRLCAFLTIGWALHYLPFFIMQRQLFLHHYLPALYFSILMLGVVFDFTTLPLSNKTRAQVAGVILLASLWSFNHWRPLAYGSTWTKSECQKAKWRSTWDFSCYDFYDKYAQYDNTLVGTTTKALDQTQTSNAAPVIEPGRNLFHEKMQDKKADTTTHGQVPAQAPKVAAPVENEAGQEERAVDQEEPKDEQADTASEARRPVGRDEAAPIPAHGQAHTAQANDPEVKEALEAEKGKQDAE